MGVKTFKPVTPSLRFTILSDRSEITKEKPEKFLTEHKKMTGGRNSQGRITAKYRGGGHKRRYRRIDFKRNKDDVGAEVCSIEYDPNRSARIAGTTLFNPTSSPALAKLSSSSPGSSNT